MKTLIALAVLTALVALFVVVIRPWMRKQPWAQPFFDKIEPIELALYRKSETLLWSRWQAFLAFIMVALPAIGAFDVTPFLIFFPERLRPFIAVAPSVALALN